MLDNGVGYVRIAQFQEKTGSDLAKQLKDLGAKEAPRAWCWTCATTRAAS